MVCSIEKSFIIRFDRIASLKLHMQQSHRVKLETRELRFKNMDEFMSWKKEEEKATESYYVLHNGTIKHLQCGIIITTVTDRVFIKKKDMG